MAAINGVDLDVEVMGEGPPVLIIARSVADWPDELAQLIIGGPRKVIRYDPRDAGASTTYPVGQPGYTLRDLVQDAAGVLDAVGVERAHVVGLSVGGWVAQLLALEHPERVETLTLIGARAVAPGPVDPDLPDHEASVMAAFGGPQPDWEDREQVVAHLVRADEVMAGAGWEEKEARERAERMTRHTADVRSALYNLASVDCSPRWRERLSDIGAPTLVLHGTVDPFFPFGNGVALAADIPGARLVPLEGVGHELPRRAWRTVAAELLDHTGGRFALAVSTTRVWSW